MRELLSSIVSGYWSGRQRELSCLDCISETIRCRLLILGTLVGGGGVGVQRYGDLDLTIDFVEVTLTFNILSHYISLKP